MVCYQHPQLPGSGFCLQCRVTLCAGCVANAHPPICGRCLAAVDVAERDAIGGRAITAALLAAIGGFATWTLFGWAQGIDTFFGLEPSPAMTFLIERHGLPAVPVGAYVLGSAPYGWYVLRSLLLPPNVSQTWWYYMMKNTVVATIVLAPFFAPAGIAHDFMRGRDAQRLRARARIVPESAPIGAEMKEALPVRPIPLERKKRR